MWPKCSINNTFPYKMSILCKSNYGFKEGFNFFSPLRLSIYHLNPIYCLQKEYISMAGHSQHSNGKISHGEYGRHPAPFYKQPFTLRCYIYI